MKDYCTGFFEYWYTWKFKKIKISDMCKDHDNDPKEGEEFKGCSNSRFYAATWKANLVGAVLISTIASMWCFLRYTKIQIKRL